MLAGHANAPIVDGLAVKVVDMLAEIVGVLFVLVVVEDMVEDIVEVVVDATTFIQLNYQFQCFNLNLNTYLLYAKEFAAVYYTNCHQPCYNSRYFTGAV